MRGKGQGRICGAQRARLERLIGQNKSLHKHQEADAAASFTVSSDFLQIMVRRTNIDPLWRNEIVRLEYPALQSTTTLPPLA